MKKVIQVLGWIGVIAFVIFIVTGIMPYSMHTTIVKVLFYGSALTMTLFGGLWMILYPEYA